MKRNFIAPSFALLLPIASGWSERRAKNPHFLIVSSSYAIMQLKVALCFPCRMMRYGYRSINIGGLKMCFAKACNNSNDMVKSFLMFRLSPFPGCRSFSQSVPSENISLTFPATFVTHVAKVEGEEEGKLFPNLI